MRRNTLYVSDLDGTLLSNDSRVSRRSAEIISELTRNGAMITVATARTPATVVPLLADTLTTPPAVVMTGCAYWLRDEGRFDDALFMPPCDVTAALELCHRLGVAPFVYVMASDGSTLDVYHSSPTLNRAEESFWLERSQLRLKRFHLGKHVPDNVIGRTMLLYAMGEGNAICTAAEAFGAATDCSVACYPDIFNKNIYNLEIFPPKVNKAAAITRLKEALGADRLVAFGDNLNDLSMLAAADVAVAVGNALPEVKAAADIVIEPNSTDAVARFIADD